MDKLIEKASTETPENTKKHIKQLEQRLVAEKAYIAPLYNSFKAQGVNKDVLNPGYGSSCEITCDRMGNNRFNDASKRETSH